ncbi:unnamed protein product [Timema podura]|uniref:Chitin-binding type-4 domain-containing protein n=1 Tax=Timema podura TaxID=61482 RepID=A0ABN7NHL3_TIMPD|nr:unnamed protein product [Timema podura]
MSVHCPDLDLSRNRVTERHNLSDLQPQHRPTYSWQFAAYAQGISSQSPIINWNDVIMWVLVLVAMAVVAQVGGHGMVMDPVSRSSMWRMGFHTPVNYDDDGNFCGGFSTQWEEHAGKCGECGDDYGLPRPRPNENTGKYGTGVIVKTLKIGQEFVAYIDVTTNHQGFFEFRLCPLQSRDELETEECFSRFLLQQQDGSTKYYILNREEGYSGYFNVTLRLPSGLTCDQCVLQWTWTVGNNWGTCDDGTEGDGCGPQETFRTCSDIAIH